MARPCVEVETRTRIASYPSATAFRQALEDRLRSEPFQTGVPYDRLRKEAAFLRLLARLQWVAPEGSWALKGALALIARTGTHVRATRDIDANWRLVRSKLEETLDTLIDTDLEDGFEFEIGDASPLRGEGPEGGLRHSVTARLAGKVFPTAGRPRAVPSGGFDGYVSKPVNVRELIGIVRQHCTKHAGGPLHEAPETRTPHEDPKNQ